MCALRAFAMVLSRATFTSYLLWARMCVNNQWNSLDEEPDTHGGLSKVPRKESLKDLFTGAAIAFAQTLTTHNTPVQQSSSTPTTHPLPSGVSPARLN